MALELLTGVSQSNPESRTMWMVIPTRVETWHELSLTIVTPGLATTPHGSVALPAPDPVVVDVEVGEVGEVAPAVDEVALW
jgi:hypothetical protein